MPRLRTLVAAAVASLIATAPASAQFVPYYGKNKVKYDNFAWRIYKSPHFEVYYYRSSSSTWRGSQPTWRAPT